MSVGMDLGGGEDSNLFLYLVCFKYVASVSGLSQMSLAPAHKSKAAESYWNLSWACSALKRSSCVSN